MKFKNLLALVLCIFIALSSLTGCGNAKEPDSSTTSDSNQSSGTNTAETTETAEPVEQTEVVFWNQVFEEWDQEFYTKRAEEYNAANRDYYVTQELIPGDAWNEKMTAAQASNTAPDTYVIAYNGIIANASTGLIQPLDGLMPQESLDDITDNVKEMVSYQGKIYAYPRLVEPSTVLFYRKDLFEAAGLTEPPKTWDQLLDYAKKLNTDEVFGLGIPSYADMGWSSWGWQMASAGHLAVNDNWDTPTIDQGYMDLAMFFKSLYDAEVVPPQALSGYPDLRPFGEGSLAMTFCGSWGIGQLYNDFPDMVENVGVAVPPTKDGNQDKPLATNGGWTHVIDAHAKNPEGAADFTFWLLGDDPQRPYEFFELAKFGKAPARKSVAELIADKQANNEWAQAVSYVGTRAIPEPAYSWDISWSVIVMFENIGLGAMSPEEAKAECEQTIKDIIVNQETAGKNPRLQ